MRFIPEALQAQLDAGVTTLAHVWRLTRRDGIVLALTDHDRPLDFDGAASHPMAGVNTGAIEKSLGLGVDTASLNGALSSEALSEEDLGRGLWDGARVDLYRVDWRDPSLRAHLFAGRLGEVRRGAQAFEAELRGLQAALNVPVGRVYSRYCDADLGDARCGKDIETSDFRAAAAVTGVLSETSFRTSGLEAFSEGWFTRGKLTWNEGGESEVLNHTIAPDGAAVLALRDAGLFSAGATFVVRAGCDKSFATCRAKFGNGLNFRGFPHIPGNDAVQAGPSAAEPLDGGSRFA